MRRLLAPRFALLCALCLALPAHADGSFSVAGNCCASFTITSVTDPVTGPNPTLTLKRGSTYTFTNATGSSHPFCLRTAAGGTSLNATNGVTGNCGVSNPAVSTWTVPVNAANTYAYQCQTHAPMTGAINIVDAAPVKSPRIVPTLTTTAAMLLGSVLAVVGVKAARGRGKGV